MSNAGKFSVPDIVRRRALGEGQAGAHWLATLGDTLASLERDWDITIGAALPGGTAAFVAEAVDPTGQVFIVKLPTPASDEGRHEAAVLTAAAGKGYVALVQHDAVRRALLLERLGPTLEELALPLRDQIDIMCATLLKAWIRMPGGAPYVTGVDKANSLGMSMQSMNQDLGQPCAQRVLDMALMYCRDRAAAWHPENDVLAHGDPHPANILAVPEHEGHFKFIDPDGLAIEPAYDLGVVLRAWHDGIAGRHAHDIARSHAHHLSTRTQVPAEAIWQWGYIERVSTGLHLMQLGETDKGREFLSVADTLTI